MFKKILNEKVLPHLGGFRLYETKSYKAKDIKYEEFHKIIEQATTSDVFGFDILLGSNYKDVCLFTSFDIKQERFEPTFVMPHSNLDNEDLKSYCFTFKPRNHEFMPISMNSEKSVVNSILSINDLTVSNLDFFWLQILCRKIDEKWKDECIEKYAEYLSGIDRPTRNALIKKIQHKMVEFLKRFDESSFINKEVESVDLKLDEEGFETVVRLAVHLQDRRMINKKVIKLFDAFSKTNDFNFWLYTEGSRDSIMESMRLRRFPLLRSDRHIFCLSELKTLIMTETKVQDIPVPIVTTEEEIMQKMTPTAPSVSSLLLSSDPEEENAPIDFKEEEDKFNSILKNIGLLKDKKKIKVVDIIQSASLQKTIFKLPTGLNYSHFDEKVKKNIQNNLGIPSIFIQMGSESNTVAISTPLETRKKVFLKSLFESSEFQDFCKDAVLPFIVGLSEDGDCLSFDLIDCPHLLVGGTTKSGKTQWINQFIMALIMLNSPEKLNLYLIDPKMIEFGIFKRFPHVKEIITENERALNLINSLTDEMDDRYKKFSEIGARSIDSYNERSGEKMPYIVCIVDEVADLMMTTENVEYMEKYIMRLGQKARGAGIHIVLATQRPSTNVITGDIKANFPSRICFAMKTTHDYRTILTQPAPRLLGKGDGVAELEGLFGLPRFQGALIANSEKEIDAAIELIADEWDRILSSGGSAFSRSQIVANNPVTRPQPCKGAEPSVLEKAKYFIAINRDAKTRSLQQYLKVDSREIKTIHGTLVNDGWLEEPSSNRSGYTIVATDEKLEAFREMFENTFAIQNGDD